jgi:hypothetical protein
MKAKHLILLVHFLITCKCTFGQEMQNINVAGVNLSQTAQNTSNHSSNKSICDTIFSFPAKPFPTGLTWDGQYLWYVDTAYIYKVSTSGNYIDSIVNPASNTFIKVGDLTFDGLNLWYADEQTAQLFKIDPLNGNVTQQMNLPSFYGQADPNGFGLCWDGTNIWHSQYLPPRLFKLNPTNGNVIDSITTSSPILGIEWINGELYGTYGDKIYKIDQITGTLQDSSSWCVPFSAGLTWDGNSLWSVSQEDTIFGSISGGKQRIYQINSDFISSAGIESSIENDVEVFPNPATETISVKGDQIKSIDIFNLTGKLIYTVNKKVQDLITEIDVSKIPKGIYIIKIYTKQGFWNKKVSVQ